MLKGRSYVFLFPDHLTIIVLFTAFPYFTLNRSFIKHKGTETLEFFTNAHFSIF